jgi:hypothetical protein
MNFVQPVAIVLYATGHWLSWISSAQRRHHFFYS